MQDLLCALLPVAGGQDGRDLDLPVEAMRETFSWISSGAWTRGRLKNRAFTHPAVTMPAMTPSPIRTAFHVSPAWTH